MGEDQANKIMGAPARQRERERERDPFIAKKLVSGKNERLKKKATRDDVWQALWTSQAERAATHVRKGLIEPSASGPSIVESSDAERSKVRRLAVRENKHIHVNLLLGDVNVEVFAHPSGGSFEDKARKRSGVQDAVEDAKGFLLRLVRALSDGPLQCLEKSKTQRGDARRQSWRDMGSKKMQIVKGPLDAPEDVPGNAPQEIISEAIESTE